MNMKNNPTYNSPEEFPDISQVRKENMRRLVKEAGSRKAFAEKMEVEYTQITNWLSPKAPRNIGPNMARKAENVMGKPRGWLDRVDGYTFAVLDAPAAGKNETEIKDTIDIPVFDVAFSMGDGAEASAYDDIVSAISVTPEWINTNLPNITSARNLRIGSGRGDSMTGTYSHGDMLFIDCGVDGVPFDGVYAFMLNDQLYIKRLQKRPDGSYNMISDNKQYEVFVISLKDKLQIFGRVVWAWNGKRL